MGAIIAPPMPAFYNEPKNVNDIINHTVGRLLDLFGIDSGIVKRWRGAGRGSERKDPSVTTDARADIRRMLERHNTLTLATVNDGVPWAASVFYASDDRVQPFFRL